jgi:hypothetical protein
MDFTKYIKELLVVHDCVILPGLGGFIANFKSAEIHPAQHTIHPPAKQILFNHSLVHNDGLLYGYVSQKSGYGYKDVQSLAEDYIRNILNSISKGNKFTLDDIGYFYQDGEKKLQFSASTSFNFLIDSYGLPTLQYREFSPVRFSETRTYRAVPADLHPQIRQRRTRRILVSAAAACLAATLVFVPIKTGYFSEARLDISKGNTYISPEITTPNVIVPEVPQELTYNIIVGSFKDFSNARQLRSNLVERGFQARILAGENEFFRVSAGESTNRDDANQVLTSIRSKGFESAWMLSN